MSPLQSVVDQPIHLNQIDRASVRQMVEQYAVAARHAGAAGENIHQWTLDQQDKVASFAATLSEPDALQFWTLYGEEMEAAANTINDETRQINLDTAHAQAKAAQGASNIATWISLVVFFGFLIFMIKMFRG